MKTYTCCNCGKEFQANHKSLCCPDCKIGKCVICGKEFKRINPYTQKTCSPKCRGEYRKQSGISKQVAEKAKKTFQDRYGVSNPSELQHFVKKCAWCGKEFETTSSRQKYCGDDYGPCPACGKMTKIKDMQIGPQACSEECRQELIRRTNLEKYGVECVFESEEIKEKSKETCLKKYGVERYQSTQEYKDRYNVTMKERYGVDYPLQNKDIHKKMSETRKHCISSDGTNLDSNYELLIYEFLKRNHIEFEREIPIEYEYDGKKKVTLIDFKIENLLFEVKGGHLLEGVFDYYPSNVPIDAKLDVYKKNHVIFITDELGAKHIPEKNSELSNGLKYLDRCSNPLIGVDINLFDSPEFPYRNDRPKCFYDVKVQGQRSSYEAFQDELLRWKMIKNRIMYSGGFIDSNQILTAMNVTRTCKQPSWFSKKFAKSLIDKYITSELIIDTFAGWGGRAQASKELGKKYIGIDNNEELVLWHNEKGFDNISYGDAKTFHYLDQCSVFICPPYQDVEIYFKGQDNELTQCQWLELVMNNIPNAREYLMVCKIVDPGWEKYIVEIKTNKSHFGTNNEYVILVPGSEKS